MDGIQDLLRAEPLGNNIAARLAELLSLNWPQTNREKVCSKLAVALAHTKLNLGTL